MVGLERHSAWCEQRNGWHYNCMQISGARDQHQVVLVRRRNLVSSGRNPTKTCLQMYRETILWLNKWG